MKKKNTKLKRKLRIVNGKRTITTYSKFKKLYPKVKYNRKSKTYNQGGLTRKNRQIKKSSAIKKTSDSIRPVQIKTRKQIVFYTKNFGATLSSEIYQEIRGITINPDITMKGLRIILVSEANKHGLKFEQEGIENKPISLSESKGLSDGKIHITIKIGNKKTEYTK